MTGPRRELRLDLRGKDRFPTLVWTGPGGVTARVPADAPAAVPGAAVDAIHLAGERLAHLPESRRRQALRRCRRLLVPGGCLDVATGGNDHEYPHHELDVAAWDCGFEARVDHVAGRAVLTVPRHRSGETPTVSILIPAYKDAHFAAALDSALAQTWPRGEIVVGDDSPCDLVARVVEERRDRVSPGWELRRLTHDERIGGRANYLGLFAAARGDYVKYLNDDDLLAPDCVARMAAALRDHPSVTLVTSYRQLVDGNGVPLPDEAFNEPVLADDGIVDGRALATLVLSRMTNLIGEPTTVMFRRADLADSRPHVMSYAGRSARRNGDMSMWTTLLARGDAAWFAAPLSSFRQHGAQVQRSDVFLQEARQAWVELVQDARGTGLLAPRHAEGIAAPADLPRKDLDADAETERAEADFQAGDTGDAERRLRTILHRWPEHGRARSDLACLDWAAGRHETAVLGALVALVAGADATPVALNLGDMLASLGRHDEAAALARHLEASARPQPA